MSRNLSFDEADEDTDSTDNPRPLIRYRLFAVAYRGGAGGWGGDPGRRPDGGTPKLTRQPFFALAPRRPPLSAASQCLFVKQFTPFKFQHDPLS